MGLVFPELFAGGGIDGPEEFSGCMRAVMGAPSEVEAVVNEGETGGALGIFSGVDEAVKVAPVAASKATRWPPWSST